MQDGNRWHALVGDSIVTEPVLPARPRLGATAAIEGAVPLAAPQEASAPIAEQTVSLKVPEQQGASEQPAPARPGASQKPVAAEQATPQAALAEDAGQAGKLDQPVQQAEMQQRGSVQQAASQQPVSLQEAAARQSAPQPAPQGATEAPPSLRGTSLLRRMASAADAEAALDVWLAECPGMAGPNEAACADLLAAALERGNVGLALSVHDAMCAACPAVAGPPRCAAGAWPAATLDSVAALVWTSSHILYGVSFHAISHMSENWHNTPCFTCRPAKQGLAPCV